MEWIIVAFLMLLVWAWDEANRSYKKRKKEAETFEPVAYENPNSASSARWADDNLLRKAGLFKSRGVRIGYSQSGKVLHYGGPGNLILISPARTGKMVCILAAALLERPARRSSRLVIDPKGELFAISHARTAQFSETAALDPFGTLKKNGVTGVKLVGYNPLSALDPKSVSFGGDIDSITDGVFSDEPGSGENSAFFNESAKLLLSTGIRAFVKYGRKEEKNLPYIREAICRDVFAFAHRFAHCGDAAVEAELSRYTSKLSPQSKSVDDIVSTFRTQTAFLVMEGIRESLMNDSIRATDLKRKPMTVHLILPLDKLSSRPVKWFRIIVSTWLNELLKAGPRGLPVLCIIDEFFSIGRLDTFQTAMSQAAGAAGLQLFPVLQDLAQLEKLYPHEGWRTFLSNSAVKIFFGGSTLDKETSDYISALCGEREIIVQSRSVREDPRSRVFDVSDSRSTVWQPLMQAHQVRAMGDREMIVLCEKVAGPIHAARKPYFEGFEFFGQYRPNPFWNGRR